MQYNKKSSKRNSNGMRGGESTPVNVNDNQKGPSEAVQAVPLEVKVYGNFDKALKAFRSLVQKERVLSTYKEKQSYEKPSDKKRRKVNESKRKQMEFCSKGECVHEEHAKNHKPRALKNSKYIKE